jgi:glycerol-3-phosphate acyltransferase PlsX
MVKIAVDLMGGAGAGNQNLRACARFSSPQELILVGSQPDLDSELVRDLVARGAQIQHCPRFLRGDESSRSLLKDPAQTSLASALQMLAEEKADAVISSADTKAVMVLGRRIVGTLESLQRPAIAKAFVGSQGRFYMLDLGANVRCSADLLLQFARLGAALHLGHDQVPGEASEQKQKGQKPRVGLLNIGTEKGKGTATLNLAAELLAADPQIDSIGFIEPSELFAGLADVIVCDGYAGNLVLKTIESVATFLGAKLKQSQLPPEHLQSLADEMDTDRYNGALFVGLNGVVIKSHGSASEQGFLHAIEQGREAVQGNLIQACAQGLASR